MVNIWEAAYEGTSRRVCGVRAVRWMWRSAFIKSSPVLILRQEDSFPLPFT